MMNIIKFLSVSRPKWQTSALLISDLCSLLTRNLSIMFCYHLYCFLLPPTKRRRIWCSAGPCFRDLLYLKNDWNWEWATLYIYTFFCTNEYPTLWRNSPKIISGLFIRFNLKKISMAFVFGHQSPNPLINRFY